MFGSNASTAPEPPDFAKFEAKFAEENNARREFLKDKSPMDVLLWLMRVGDLDPATRAQCAIALLPYMHPKIRAIDPEPEKPEGQDDGRTV